MQHDKENTLVLCLKRHLFIRTGVEQISFITCMKKDMFNKSERMKDIFCLGIMPKETQIESTKVRKGIGMGMGIGIRKRSNLKADMFQYKSFESVQFKGNQDNG